MSDNNNQQQQENKFYPPPLNLNPKKPTYIIGIPRYHENLFQIIRDNHEWLAESIIKRSNNTTTNNNDSRFKQSFSKKIIAGTEDHKKLEKLILDLRLEKSEIFIDNLFHPKPVNQLISEYIEEFLKNKGVGTYYTFRNYYRVTVFPKECIGYDTVRERSNNDGGKQSGQAAPSNNNNNPYDQRQEYLIIPLYILLKRGKTYEQMKMLSYNPDGSYNVENVNFHHFYRLPIDEEEQEKEDKMKEKVRIAYE